MAFDAHKNLGIAPVVTGPVPPSSGTTLAIDPLNAARFPAPPFQATVWPPTELPTPVNAEVVRVTNIVGGTLTITRAQEGTTARTIVPGDLIAATITAKVITDLESGTNFPLITTAGAVTASTFASQISTGAVLTNAAPGSGSRYTKLTNSDGIVFLGMDSAAGADFGRGANSPAQIYCTTAGGVSISADAAAGQIRFYTGAGVPTPRGLIHPSGGFSWGGSTDPGAGALHLTNPTAGALAMTILGAGVGTNYPISFQNGNGQVGFIQTSASATSYNTTSDARLKTSRGRHTDLDVLRRTVIHDFTWPGDGTPARGVFAQEAQRVAPFAVSVGSDDRDDQGRLTQPWGVDYSKYVPDLITGWQDHDAKIDQLLAAVETNVALIERLTAVTRRASVYQRLRTWIAALWPAWVTP